MLDAGPRPYVAISEIAVPAEGADALRSRRLYDELPPDAHRPALELLHAVTR